jgi:cephalosporin hydroxylase
MRRRLAQHLEDSYMGRAMTKFPEDLRAYERFMWQMRANSVIELGVAHGGSTLWFRDRLQALGGGVIVAVDVDGNPDLPDDIRFVRGDILDPQLPYVVESLLPERARPFIIEDTAHTYETTTAALDGFHHLTPAGGYLIIEDGVVDVDELRIDDTWPRGVQHAITDWLLLHPQFSRVPSPYGVTCHPGGFLVKESSS